MTTRSQYLDANYRAVFLFTYGDFPHPCYFCGGEVDGHLKPWDDTAAVVHHVDHNRSNNDPANLVPGHRKCHTDYHRLSPETQSRQRASQLRRWKRDGPIVLTPPQRAKLSAAKMGHPVSDEQRAKQSAKMRGRKLTAEQRAKQSAALRGKPKSETHRANIAAARKGKPSPFKGKHSPESIAKMRAAYAARPKVACERCGVELTANTLVRHLLAHDRADTKQKQARTRPPVRREKSPPVRQRKVYVRLSPEQQAEVFARWHAGEKQVALAAEYGVSQPYVSTIVRRIAAQEVPT